MSIVLRGLVKSYGGQPVVDRVSVEISDGELFVLLGASGSGKSTILRLIAGLTPADAGQILLEGRDVTALPPQVRNVGFVFQNYALFRHMTVAENVEFGLSVRKVAREERRKKRDELLALVGLAGFARRYPAQLSGGQQQRVAVARALAFEPTVLLLDEPFGALDVRIRMQLRAALRDVQRKLRITTILVTHDQGEAFELADRIGILDHGHLLDVGPPQQLYRQPQHEYVARFLGDANLIGCRRVGNELRLGSLRVPLQSRPQRGDRWALLIRPEHLILDDKGGKARGESLGEAVVEEVLELGPTARLSVRMDALEEAWPIGRGYGEEGLPLQVSIPIPSEAALPFRVGDPVRVSVAGWHVLPMAARRFLIAEETGRAEAAGGTVAALAEALGAEVSLFVSSAAAAAHSKPTNVGEETQEGSMEVRVVVGDDVLGEVASGGYDLLALSRPASPQLRERSLRLARRSPVSVLAGDSGGGPIRRILLCTGAGEPGKLDVFFGAEIARSAGAEATLLYVDDRSLLYGGRKGHRPSVGKSELAAWIESHLAQGAKTLAAQRVRGRITVRRGRALEQILAESEEGKYDLIVIGSHLEKTRPPDADRNLALDLIAQARPPVLVVRGRL